MPGQMSTYVPGDEAGAKAAIQADMERRAKNKNAFPAAPVGATGQELLASFVLLKAKCERTVLSGLKMAKAAVEEAAEQSGIAAEQLAPLGLANPIQDILGVGGSTGIAYDSAGTFVAVLRRVANRLASGNELSADGIKAP